MGNQVATFLFSDKRVDSSEFDFIPSTNEKRLLLDTLSFPERDIPATWYTAEDGRTKLLRYANGDRGAYFEVIVNEATQAATDNTLAELRRWCRRAIEAEYDPRNNRPIYLKVKPTGSGEATYHRIKFAKTDESRSLLTTLDADAWRIGISLVLYPVGRANAPYALSTLIANGDFSLWNAAATVPTAWSMVNSGTGLRVSDYALVGPYSCQVTSSGAADGIQCTTSPVAAYHLSIGQIWIKVNTGTWKVQLRSTTAGELASVTGLTSSTVAANAEMTAVDRTGHTWGLIQVAQTTENTDADALIRVTCTSGAGVCYVDGAVVKSIEAINRIPYPGMDVTNHFVWVDGWAVSGYLESGQSDGHTVAGTGTNRFLGAKGATVTLDTQTGTDGYYRCLLLAPDRQERVFSAGFWIRFATDGNTDLKIDLRDGATNVLDTVTIDSGNIASEATTSATGADSSTWYFFQLSGTNSDAPGVYLYFAPTAIGSGVDMNFYLDQVFVYEGTGPSSGQYAQMFSPNAESSAAGYSGTLVNNAANENWVRFYNVPGDEPAALDLRGTIFSDWVASEDEKQIWINKYEERRYPEIDNDIEAEDFSDGASPVDGAWTIPYSTGDAANGSGGAVARFLASAATSSGYIEYTIVPHPPNFPAGDPPRWASQERRVKLRARTNDIDGVTLQFKWVTQGGNTINSWQSAEELFTTADTWEELDLGALFMKYSDFADGYYAAYDDSLQIHVVTKNDATDLWLDLVRFPAVPDGGYGFFYFSSFFEQDTFLTDGRNQELIRGSEGSQIWSVGSGVWDVPPGNISSKLSFSFLYGDNEHDLDEYMILHAKVWPTTTGLIGTI